jgi:hypothetical protein
MKKRIFAVLALALTFGGLYAGVAATPASAQEECELIRVYLTINGIVPTTRLLCI